LSIHQALIPGDLCHLKVSGEQVVVLEYHQGSNEYEIRRCVRRKLKGSAYVIERYFAFELETPEDHLLKRKQEMDELASVMRQAGVAVIDDRKKGPTAPPNFDNRTH